MRSGRAAASAPPCRRRPGRPGSTPSRAKRSRWRFNGWCCPYFSKTIVASRLGPAQPRGVGWNGAGGWLIFSQSRHVNFSRTVWITFHWRGMTSSVSVTSSPILESFCEPQHAQASGGVTTTRSRGRCAGNGLRPNRRRRVKPLTRVAPAAACSAANSSSVALASSSSSWSSLWSRSRCLRSERWPKSARRSFSIISFRAAICASASDTCAAAFAARASASLALASDAASAAFSASISDPSGMNGSESQQPLRRHANPVR